MAFLIVRSGKQIIRQPTDIRQLFHATIRLQQLHSTKNTTILVLPSATGCQQLLQHQSSIGYFMLVPLQSTKIRNSAQYCSCQDGTCTQARASRNCRQQSHLNTRSKTLELFLPPNLVCYPPDPTCRTILFFLRVLYNENTPLN